MQFVHNRDLAFTARRGRYRSDRASCRPVTMLAGKDAGFITYNAMPNALSPAQLILLNGGLYGLVSGPTPASPVYQTYIGCAAFSSP